jgi:hypothetical protein
MFDQFILRQPEQSRDINTTIGKPGIQLKWGEPQRAFFPSSELSPEHGCSFVHDQDSALKFSDSGPSGMAAGQGSVLGRAWAQAGQKLALFKSMRSTPLEALITQEYSGQWRRP